MSQTIFQPTGGGGGGGDGLSNIDWYLPDGQTTDLPCVTGLNLIGLDSLIFSDDDDTFAYGILPVPVTYSAGTQIFLKNGLFHTSATSGQILFRTVSYIFRANISGTANPSGYLSTNVVQSPNGTTNLFSTLNNLDITSITGTIDSVAVAAGDTLFIKLFRNVSGESGSVTSDVYLLRESLRAVLS